MVVPEWGCTATEKAEKRLMEYSNVLSGLINSELKREAMLGVGNNRYMCNQEIYEKLDPDIKSKLHPDRPNPSEQKNLQYSNIDKQEDDNKKQREIDTLYVEIQGDIKDRNLKESRNGAIWLGAYPYATKINKIGRIIVELHKDNPSTGQKDLTGSFIINLGNNGEIEIGPVYSQANLIIRAVYQGNKNNYIKFNDTVFSEKVLSFSFDDEYAGRGFAYHHFGANAILAADLVLFGYGYEIGPNVVTPKLGQYDIQTFHYDDLTNYMQGAYNKSTPDDSNWWQNGLVTIDWVMRSGSTIYDLSGLKLSSEEDIRNNPYALEELELLDILWGSVDKEEPHHKYYLPSKYGDNKYTISEYDLYGSLYGELGRWPTEFEINVGTDNKNSGIVNCPMESIPQTESASGKLRLVE